MFFTSIQKKGKPITKTNTIVNTARARVEIERTISRISFVIVIVIDDLFIIPIVVCKNIFHQTIFYNDLTIDNPMQTDRTRY